MDFAILSNLFKNVDVIIEITCFDPLEELLLNNFLLN